MTRIFIQPARSIKYYALVRKTILLNQKVLQQLDRGNKKIPSHDSELAKHLKKNIDESCNCTFLIIDSKNAVTIKNLELSLNDQLKSNKLLLFRNDITCFIIQKTSIHCNKYFQYSSQQIFFNAKKTFLLNRCYSFEFS